VSSDFKPLIAEVGEVFPVIDALARTIHDGWYQERKAQGWRYAPKRNDGNREHHLMLDFDELPESAKQQNRLTARDTHAKLLDVGFRIVPYKDSHDGQDYVSKEE